MWGVDSPIHIYIFSINRGGFSARKRLWGKAPSILNWTRTIIFRERSEQDELKIINFIDHKQDDGSYTFGFEVRKKDGQIDRYTY